MSVIHPFDPAISIYIAETKYRQTEFALRNLKQQGYRVWPDITTGYQTMSLRYLLVQPESPTHSISPVRSTPGISNLLKIGPSYAILHPNNFEAIISDNSFIKADPEQRILILLGAAEKDTQTAQSKPTYA